MPHNKEPPAVGHRSDKNDKIKQISDFIDAMRMKDKDDCAEEEEPCTSRDIEPDAAYKAAKERAEKAVLEAEKYKALIAEPPGECMPNFGNLGVVRTDIGGGLSDNNFFHLTCHIDENLVAKIEKGEYVDLDKLLSKDKRKKLDESRMEWVHSENGTYLALMSDRTSKITGFRKWEQAFRVYATIYCGANPHRSKEIWQYVSVISTAASSFLWENVFEYDVTFHHLMAFNPSRSWAVTYNQMWNLCMKEPVVTKSAPSARPNFGNNLRYNGNGSNKNRKKPKYCWNFNRGEGSHTIRSILRRNMKMIKNAPKHILRSF